MFVVFKPADHKHEFEAVRDIPLIGMTVLDGILFFAPLNDHDRWFKAGYDELAQENFGTFQSYLIFIATQSSLFFLPSDTKEIREADKAEVNSAIEMLMAYYKAQGIRPEEIIC